MPSQISWSIRPETSRTVQVCFYGAFGLLGGWGFLAVTSIALVVATQAVHGEFWLLALAVLFILIGGPLSVLYLWPLLTDPRQRPTRAQLVPAGVTPRRLGGVSLLSAIVLVGAAWLDPLGPFLVVGSGVVVLLPVGAMLQSEGEIDPTERTLTTGDHTVALDTLTGVRRVSAGGLTVHWLSYAAGTASVPTPRLLVLPTPTARTARETLERGIDHAVPETTQSASNQLVQATLGGIGIGFLGGAILLLVIDPFPTGTALWMSSLVGMFGLIFLWAAVTEP